MAKGGTTCQFRQPVEPFLEPRGADLDLYYSTHQLEPDNQRLSGRSEGFNRFYIRKFCDGFLEPIGLAEQRHQSDLCIRCGSFERPGAQNGFSKCSYRWYPHRTFAAYLGRLRIVGLGYVRYRAMCQPIICIGFNHRKLRNIWYVRIHSGIDHHEWLFQHSAHAYFPYRAFKQRIRYDVFSISDGNDGVIPFHRICVFAWRCTRTKWYNRVWFDNPKHPINSGNRRHQLYRKLFVTSYFRWFRQ